MVWENLLDLTPVKNIHYNKAIVKSILDRAVDEKILPDIFLVMT